MFATGFVVGLVICLAYIGIAKCSFRVEEGHVGVLVSFGAARFRDATKQLLEVYRPGLHAKRPWEHAISVSMKEQQLELSGEKGGHQAMADDGTVLRFDSILRYAPVEEKLAHFLFSVKKPLSHITGLFSCLLRNEIANFRSVPPRNTGALVATSGETGIVPPSRLDFETEAGSYALIRRERRLLNQRIEDFCKERIGDRYGVKFNAVDLTDILPPDELADALNAVIQARSEAEGAFYRAEGECQQRILAATEGVAIAKTRGEAVETEIVRLAEFLKVLDDENTLDAYVSRRKSEVLSESRAVFVRDSEVRS